MKLRTLVLASLLGLVSAVPSVAQEACRLLCQPVFLAQPGLVVSNAVNAPALDAAGTTAEASSEFLFRVVTVVPTELPRLSLVGVVQWTPFAEVAGVAQNAPTFVYGPVLSLLSAGPVGVTLNALGAYGPASSADQQYEHQFVLEVDAALNVGSWLGADAPQTLRGLSAYAFLAQPMTNRPVDFRGEAVYSPAVLVGLSVPLAPWQ